MRRWPSIRELEPGEWEAFRLVRLAALLDAPDAFRRLHADEAAVPDARWKAYTERIAAEPSSGIFVADAGDRLVGLVLTHIEAEHPVVSIGGMWVAPAFRRKGVGTALVEQAVAWGVCRDAVRARLAVTIGNRAAEALYRTWGFVPTGEREPLREGSSTMVVWLERGVP